MLSTNLLSRSRRSFSAAFVIDSSLRKESRGESSVTGSNPTRKGLYSSQIGSPFNLGVPLIRQRKGLVRARRLQAPQFFVEGVTPRLRTSSIEAFRNMRPASLNHSPIVSDLSEHLRSKRPNIFAKSRSSPSSREGSHWDIFSRVMSITAKVQRPFLQISAIFLSFSRVQISLTVPASRCSHRIPPNFCPNPLHIDRDVDGFGKRPPKKKFPHPQTHAPDRGGELRLCAIIDLTDGFGHPFDQAEKWHSCSQVLALSKITKEFCPEYDEAHRSFV